MLFTVLERNESPPDNARNHAFLFTDYWDDWGKFRTQFFLTIYDGEGEKIDIGSVKIGQVALQPCQAGKVTSKIQRTPDIPSEFNKLNNQFFSLGQSENYYEMLHTISDATIAISVLKGLRDCAYNLNLFEKYSDEEVMGESLLRDIQRSTVKGRFHRLAHGDANLTEFNFEYVYPQQDTNDAVPVLSFYIKPESSPPTNTHVIIGRNGVGKTSLINNMINAISMLSNNSNEMNASYGIIRPLYNDEEFPFSNIVSVAFSAFDTFIKPNFSESNIKHSHVGLWHKLFDDAKPVWRINVNDLSNKFYNSLNQCKSGLRLKRWIGLIKTLENDPLFAENMSLSFLDKEKDEIVEIFSRLSSGHAIVLLTTTILVELVEEKTLVIIDEPESHLHPPLLSAFIRCLTDLLIKRNGVAIIATHSPVVLQEVPRSCVWNLRRNGTDTIVERPQIETFGENVSVLTRHIFGLEVTYSGFHSLMVEAIEKNNLDYKGLLKHFGGQLGAEARAIAQALVADRDRRIESI